VVLLQDAPLVAGVNAEPFGWLSANVDPGSSLAHAHLQDDTRKFRKENPGSSLDTAPPLHEWPSGAR
jgi:hypothetical protein